MNFRTGEPFDLRTYHRLRVGYLIGEHWEAGVLFDFYANAIRFSGSTDFNVHSGAYGAYYFGEGPLRPYARAAALFPFEGTLGCRCSWG